MLIEKQTGFKIAVLPGVEFNVEKHIFTAVDHVQVISSQHNFSDSSRASAHHHNC